MLISDIEIRCAICNKELDFSFNKGNKLNKKNSNFILHVKPCKNCCGAVNNTTKKVLK